MRRFRVIGFYLAAAFMRSSRCAGASRHGRIARSPSSCRGAPAARPTSSRARSRRCWRRTSKVPVNVVLRPGGSGAVGHTAIAQAAPDGYTWGLATVEITMMHWQKLAPIQPKDFTVAAIINADAGGLIVRTEVALQDRQGIARRHQGEAGRDLQGVRHRAGRHLASRPRRLAARREGRPEEGAVGAEPGRRSLDAGSRRGRRRLRHRVAARGPRADRRRQGARARPDGWQAPRALSERADAEGRRRAPTGRS